LAGWPQRADQRRSQLAAGAQRRFSERDFDADLLLTAAIVAVMGNGQARML
jgi:hypothetical protein